MGLNYDQLNKGGMLDRVLSTLPYPMTKDTLISAVQKTGANQQILDTMRQNLPDKEFRSADDIKNVIRSTQKQ